MLGTIIIIIIIVALLYAYMNDKLNFGSINDSSPSVNNSGDSSQINPEGRVEMRFNNFNNKVRNMRISYGDNGNTLAKLSFAESPLTINQITEHGNRSVGANSVFLGLIDDHYNNEGMSLPNTTRTANFTLKRFKNMFIAFKGVDYTEVTASNNIARYECNGMVYSLIDNSSSGLPDLRDIPYPIVILTNNVQLIPKLQEWGYKQITENLFIKNENQYRYY